MSMAVSIMPHASIIRVRASVLATSSGRQRSRGARGSQGGATHRVGISDMLRHEPLGHDEFGHGFGAYGGITSCKLKWKAVFAIIAPLTGTPQTDRRVLSSVWRG